MEIHYIIDGCYKWTFDAKKVKKIVENNCKGTVLNLFAGKNRLNVYETRVDSSDEFRPDFHYPADKFLIQAEEFGLLYDTIIYDPPWNERKSKEKYNGHYIGKFTKLKNAIVRALSVNGIIISVGYEITNFGRKRNMELSKVYAIDPKGEIRPYFVSIERLVIPSLTEYF